MSTETVPTKRSGGISDLKKMFGGGTSSSASSASWRR